MNPETLLNSLDLESGYLAIGLIATAVILIAILNRRRLLARWHEWQVERSLARIGREQIRFLSCPDGLDGFYRIDRLALTADAIVLLAYKPFNGNIYCAERISEWTQVVEQKSFKFENPLFELENQLTSLRLLVGNAPLRGYLLFNRHARFPKGHPDSVMSANQIPENFLGENIESVKAEVQAAWDLLKSQHQGASEPSRVGVKT